MKRIVVAMSVAATLLAGCSKVLNEDRLESEIEQGIQEQTGATGVQVDCPSDRPLEQGDTFTCSAQDDQGGTGEVRVTQTDEEGNVRWELNPGT